MPKHRSQTLTRQHPDPGTSTWNTASPRNPEEGLTLERIVSAGIAIADREGLSALSIRRIATDLQSSPMALYHYVRSKRDLLNLMLDAANAEFKLPVKPVVGWRDVLIHFARESRRSLKRHSWIALIRAGGPEYGPESIRILEWLLGSLIGCGLDRKTAASTIGILFVFVNGFVAEEGTSADKRALFSKPVLATGKFPHVVRFLAKESERAEDEEFDHALNWILDGIAAETGGRDSNKRKRKV